MYGGAIQAIQYKYWIQCLFGALGGVLLRAADIKRKNSAVFNNLMRIYTVLTLGKLVNMNMTFLIAPTVLYCTADISTRKF